MATGLGKTITVALDVKKWLSGNQKSRILYLCHQNDILSQAREKFEAIVGTNLDYGYYHGSAKESHAQILFASFQTMRGHLKQFRRDEFEYIIVDESHHTHAETYLPIVRYFRPKFLLGVTATPDRADLQDIREIFGKEVFSLNLPEALAKEYLTPVDYRLITDELLELSKIKNSYKLTLQELNKRLFIPRRDNEIVRIIYEKIAHIKNPRIMIFCSSIKHAERFCKHIPGAIPIHSLLLKREQRSRLKAFREGFMSMAVTVDKFNEGIDIPEINVVVFLRSTQSSTIFHQQLGRGLRKIKDKKSVLVLDFVANCERIKMIHDLVEDVRKIQKRRRGKVRLPICHPRNKVTIRGLNFIFTEKAMNILDIFKRLERKRGGYTRSSLLEYLQGLADDLDRSPTVKDVNQLCEVGKGWSSKTIIDVFGSFTQAKKEAGLATYRKPNLDKKEAIRQLKNLTKKLGRSPTYSDITRASRLSRCPSPAICEKLFGSTNQALMAANIPLVRIRHHSRPEIIGEIKRLARELRKVPEARDVKEASKLNANLPTTSTLSRLFGSFNNALKKAGLPINRHRKSEQVTA